MKSIVDNLVTNIFDLRIYLLQKVPYKAVFIVTGILSTLWFLLRVIPKPSRAGYPCMQAAAPFMSGFVLYLLSFSGSFFAFRKANNLLTKKNYAPALVFLFIGIVMGATFFVVNNYGGKTVAAPNTVSEPFDGPNNPMGTPQGVVPGRVIWAWNPDATNSAMTNVPGDAFWDYHNNDTLIIRGMFDHSILLLTDKETHAEAWEAIFTYHNERKSGETHGYQAGEKVFVKVNQGTAGWLVNTEPEYGWPTSGGLNAINQSWKRNYFGATETGPFVVLNLLRHLVNIAGVPQENIYVGDPMAIIFKHNYDIWHGEFPNVKYVEKRGPDHNRYHITPANEPSMFYSDDGGVLGESVESFFSVMEEVEYMINVATFKPHKRGGVTFTAKNHFGSITRNGAGHLHPALISTSDQGMVPHNEGYNKYRVMVDIMGHKYLGRNTMLYIVEGLFGGSEDEVLRPVKYFMEPFNGDWANSIFMSLDQVALESVAYDFMRAEFDGETNPGLSGNYPDWPNWYGVDDYLHQAADPANWPEDFIYNPDGQGPLPSLGVHEHWNNKIDKQYSGNLGLDGGIELVKTNGFAGPVNVYETVLEESSLVISAYPNPFTDQFTLSVRLKQPAVLTIEVLDLQGRIVAKSEPGYMPDGKHLFTFKAVDMGLTPGMYLLRVFPSGTDSKSIQTHKVYMTR